MYILFHPNVRFLMKQLILISLLLCSAFAAEGTDSTSNRKKRKHEDRPVRVVPIPEISSNPTFGTGGGAMVLMTYPVSKTDTISPKSTLFAKGTYYNTHSYMFLVGNRFFLKEDKFRIPLAAGRSGSTTISIILSPFLKGSPIQFCHRKWG